MLKNKALRVLKEPITNQNVRVLCHSLLFHAPNSPIYRRFHRVLQHCLYVTLSVIWTGCFFIRRKFHQEADTSPKSPQVSEVRFERFKGQKFAIKTAEVSCYFWTNWVVATWNFGAPPFWSLKDNKHDVGCWRPKAPEGRWLDHHRDLFYSVHDRGTVGEFNTICSSLKAIGRKPRRGCLQLTLYASWVQVL